MDKKKKSSKKPVKTEKKEEQLIELLSPQEIKNKLDELDNKFKTDLKKLLEK